MLEKETRKAKLPQSRKLYLNYFRVEGAEKVTEVKEKKAKSSGNPMKELAAKKKDDDKSSSSLSSSEDDDH